MNSLLSCPFCGGRDQYITDFGITCRGCDTQVVGAGATDDIAAWNRRANPIDGGEGWELVPREPGTCEGDDSGHVLAFLNTLHEHLPEDERPTAWMQFSDAQRERIQRAYRAMLAASPSPGIVPESGAGAVAWRVKDFADGWIVCNTEAEAMDLADGTGNLVQPLYTSPETAVRQTHSPEAGGGGEDYYPSHEALSDLVHLQSEHDALNGGGPNWQARWDAALRRAEDIVRVEP